MSFLRRNMLAIGLGATLALAAASGFLASVALSVGNDEPTSTTTIDVATGPTGPQGPPGPAGTVDCGTGYHTGIVVINAPGGQVTLKVCVKN